MPLYEYECDLHGHRFEVIQKFSDPPVEVCPKCGAPVHKVISSPAFQFKGSGWYVTDYARKDSAGGKEQGESSAKTESKDSKESSTSEKDSGAKTDSTAKKDTNSKKSEPSSSSDTKSST